MPVFDYKCPNGHVREDVRIFNHPGATQTHIKCNLCGALMEKQWASTNFNIKGYAESNGYSRKSS